jgi:hypothetical protein
MFGKWVKEINPRENFMQVELKSLSKHFENSWSWLR